MPLQDNDVNEATSAHPDDERSDAIAAARDRATASPAAMDDAAAADHESAPDTEGRLPPLLSRIGQVLESDVAWGMIVLAIIATAATFAT